MPRGKGGAAPQSHFETEDGKTISAHPVEMSRAIQLEHTLSGRPVEAFTSRDGSRVMYFDSKGNQLSDEQAAKVQERKFIWVKAGKLSREGESGAQKAYGEKATVSTQQVGNRKRAELKEHLGLEGRPAIRIPSETSIPAWETAADALKKLKNSKELNQRDINFLNGWEAQPGKPGYRGLIATLEDGIKAAKFLKQKGWKRTEVLSGNREM